MRQSRFAHLPKLLLVGGVVCSVQLSPVYAAEPHMPKQHSYKDSVFKAKEILTLEDAIAKSIKLSPRLKSSQAGLDAAKGSERQAGYWPNPEIEFEAENVAGDNQFSGTDSAEYTYGLSQKVEIGGKRSSRKKAAKAARKFANTLLTLEKLNIERDTHIAYANVLAEAEALKLAVEQEKLAKAVLKTVSKRVAAAKEPEIQKSKAEVAYVTASISREQEERQLKLAKKKLSTLWGESKLNVSLDHAHFFDLKNPDPIEKYNQKLNNSPELISFMHLADEKESLLSLEKANAIPDPSLNAGVRDFRESGSQAFVFGVSLPLPVLNLNQGNVARARAEVTQAQSNKKQAEFEIKQQLTENWHNWQISYLEANKLSKNIIPAAKKAFRLARAGYEKGKFPYLEVLDAQRTLFEARAKYHESLKNYHASRANVERIVGLTYQNQEN